MSIPAPPASQPLFCMLVMQRTFPEQSFSQTSSYLELLGDNFVGAISRTNRTCLMKKNDGEGSKVVEDWNAIIGLDAECVTRNVVIK